MNKDFRNFISRLLILVLLVIIASVLQLMAGIFIIGCQYQCDYMASAVDKIARMKSITTPKITLIGNSNLAFGMDSKMLEDALNMPVVNLGLHGGLSNAFYENMARISVNSGDILILCHSSYADDDKLGDISLAWQTVEYHKSLWNLIREKDYPDMLRGWPKYWLRSLLLWATFLGNKPSPPPYTRDAFNEYGDVVAKPENARYPLDVIFKPGSISVPRINETCTRRINSLNKYVKDRGAVLLVAGYPVASGDYTPPAADYAKFQESLARKLDCEIISDFRDYFIPYEYFYNTTLHLDKRGTKLRTSQLIKDIKNWQARRK